MAPNLARYLLRQLGPAVVHGEQQPPDPKIRVEVALNQIDRPGELGQPL
jgi:hypothetical protein